MSALSRAAGRQQRTGKRQLRRLSSELSERDWAILRSVGDCHFLSTRQLERLHFPPSHHTPLSAARSSRRVLVRLSEQRVMVRLERRIDGVRAGSTSFVYALGPVGRRLLGDHESRRRVREPSLTFLNHTLAVAELVVHLVEASRAGELELLGYETEPRCWRQYLGAHGSREVLKPDLRLTIGQGALEHHWFVEVDLGSEHLPAIRRKCRQYASYYRSGQEQARVGIFPKVAWLTSTSQRSERVAAAVAGDGGVPKELFVIRPIAEALPLLSGQEVTQ